MLYGMSNYDPTGSIGLDWIVRILFCLYQYLVVLIPPMWYLSILWYKLSQYLREIFSTVFFVKIYRRIIQKKCGSNLFFGLVPVLHFFHVPNAINIERSVEFFIRKIPLVRTILYIKRKKIPLDIDLTRGTYIMRAVWQYFF